MPRYIIEREIPGAGDLSAADLHGISQKSCAVQKLFMLADQMIPAQKLGH